MDEKSGTGSEIGKRNEPGTREISSTEWFDYFGRFNREHDGQLSTLRILNTGFGAQVEARNLPFVGIVAGRSAPSPIEISLGRGVSTTHIEHNLPDPVRVFVQSGADGRELAIEIESKDGTKTILEILPAAPGKTV